MAASRAFRGMSGAPAAVAFVSAVTNAGSATANLLMYHVRKSATLYFEASVGSFLAS